MFTARWLLFFILLYPLNAFSQDFQVTDSSLYLKAKRLCRDYIVIDTHNDLPGWLYDEWFDISQLSDKGETDYPRAIEGGLDAMFMSVFTSPGLEGTGKAKTTADSIIKVINKIADEWPDKFSLVTTSKEVRKKSNKGKLLLAIGMENGSPIENNINNVDEFYRKGIRYITLCHYKSNHICDSANDTVKLWNGVSPFGESVISEMNRLGIMIDVSHISDSSFFDVLKLSKAPVIASHSSCRFFTPDNPRNISDDEIKAIARKGGVVQVNFASFFLVDSVFRKSEKGDAEIKAFMDTHKDTSETNGYAERYWKEHPLGGASVKDVADHIDHIVRLAGIDHAGLGSDFNGVGGYVPQGLEDVSKYPNLVYELLSRGYKEKDIKKILGENLLRVWKKVEEVSKRLNK